MRATFFEIGVWAINAGLCTGVVAATVWPTGPFLELSHGPVTTPGVGPAGGPASSPPTRARRYRLGSAASGTRELHRRFRPELLGLLEKLNRADLAHLARLPTMVMPADPPDGELEYSPLPISYSWALSFRKALVVDQPSQVFGAYEHGQLVRWGPVSSGCRRAPTPSGLFHCNWRSPARTSTLMAKLNMQWYFNFSNEKGFAFHQFDLPGLPASHGCVRLLARDAQWLYSWSDGWVLDDEERKVLREGTPVLILGKFDFASPPPWRQIGWLSMGVDLPAEPRPVEPGPARPASVGLPSTR